MPHTTERTIRWNMAVNLMDISFFTFGLSLVSRETVVPLLVSQLTNSTVAIGVIPAVYSLSIYLPQLFGARVAASMPLKKPYVTFWGAVGERLPYLLIGVAVLLLARPAPMAAFIAMVVLFGLSAGAAGFVMPAWFDLISKVIPLERRGLFTGASNGFGALLGVAGAAVMALILERVAYPQNYALLFLLGFASLLVSLFGLSLTREAPSEGLHPPLPLSGFLRSLPAVLQRDHNFRRFITASMATRAGTMAGGFFLVYGTGRFGISGAEVGLLTGVLIGAQAVLNPVWGVLGDRRGHKVALVAGALSLGLAAAVAWLGPTWPWLILAFALLGSFLATESASFLTILPEFCAEPDRPTYIGLTNTLLAPVASLAPLVGGALAATIGYRPMFALAALAATLGALALALWVREPRYAPRPRAALPGDGELT